MKNDGNKNVSVDGTSMVLNIVFSAMFIAVGIILPFFTGQIKQIGNMLLPMHIPVLLCGMICGWQYGGAIGFILPIMRSTLFGMPMMFPTAVAMSFELATYGIVVGILYGRSKWKCIVSLYYSMISSMIAGRVVWGVVMMILLGMNGNAFTVNAFITSAILNAIPGIILQLVFIPAVMLMLKKTKMVDISRKFKSGNVQNEN